MKRTKILTAGIIAAFGLAMLTSSAVYADDSPDTVSTIVERVAKKFNLKEADVQAVFDAEREARFESRLSTLVKEGKITETQKKLLIEKHKEMETKNRTNRTEFQKWAKDNGINLESLGPFGKGFGHHGMMR